MKIYNNPYKNSNLKDFTPFESAEEAWFWFIAATRARLDGARFTAGLSDNPRPCEPIDILKTIDRLYRLRRLTIDHLRVIRHYGFRHMAPDPRRPNESRAFTLWEEAMMRLESALEQKGIVRLGEFPQTTNEDKKGNLFPNGAHL